MALLPGTRLGPYAITASIGAGGMGEVYKATDTRLDRTVAIKVLPEHVASDADFQQRFEREAKTLAALTHPHICHIHDVGRQDGIDFLVMECLEGETLEQRLKKGALPLDQALGVGIEIADALAAAHRGGIVHRDLKPGNIMLTKSGAKLLDFGLAKKGAPAVAGSLSMLPTTPANLTAQGTILGTFQYMAPEQLEGQEADARTDIFAFGAVLYEMVTGKKAFEGKSQASLIAAILEREPTAMSTLQPLTPPMLDHVVRRCLSKRPDDRWQSTSDVMSELKWISGAGDELHPAAVNATPEAGRARERLWRMLTVASVIALVALSVPAISHLRESPAPDPLEVRSDINVPGTTNPVSFALSPDGRQIVFAASSDGVQRLWLRSIAATSAQPLVGTEGGSYPFWSPDSRSIGFFAEGRLRRLDLGAGQPQTLATVAGGRGGTWNADGIIVFNQTSNGPLFRMSAAGGQVMPLTTVDGQQLAHNYPRFLPDGRHFLFFALGTPETQGIYLASLDSADTMRLAASDTAAAYLEPGWLLWVRDGSLVAQQFDLAHPSMIGEAVQVAFPVASEALGGSAVSTSTTGMVAYRIGGQGRRQLRWVDRSGKVASSLGSPDETGLSAPRLSPDARQVAVIRIVQGNTDIWLLDGSRASRFTFDPAADRFAEWSPDGSQLAFDSQRKGPRHLYVKRTDLTGGDQLLLELESGLFGVASDWSPDGRFLLYISIKPNDYDVGVLPLIGDRKPFPFLSTEFTEKGAQFSPDGHWVTYMSNQSGRMEIYVRPFLEAPGGETKSGQVAGQWVASTGGGIYPAWRPDGKELFYLAPDGTMMAVPISITATKVDLGAPVPLFSTQIMGGGIDNQQNRQYDVARDGRFLINTLLDDATPITLIQNWNPAAPK